MTEVVGARRQAANRTELPHAPRVGSCMQFPWRVCARSASLPWCVAFFSHVDQIAFLTVTMTMLAGRRGEILIWINAQCDAGWSPPQ